MIRAWWERRKCVLSQEHMSCRLINLWAEETDVYYTEELAGANTWRQEGTMWLLGFKGHDEHWGTVGGHALPDHCFSVFVSLTSSSSSSSTTTTTTTTTTGKFIQNANPRPLPTDSEMVIKVDLSSFSYTLSFRYSVLEYMRPTDFSSFSLKPNGF